MVKATGPIKYTQQEMFNWSFDDLFKENTVELYGFDTTNNVLRRITVDSSGNLLANQKETPPTDSSKLNGSLILGYDEYGNMTTLTKVVEGVTYTKTLTYDGSDKLTNVSAWS